MKFTKSLLAISITTILASNVNAQETQAEKTEADEKAKGIEQIEVRGQRYARAKALDMKRESPVVMDALSVDNMGKLPDKNLAESLNRLPGVSVLMEKGEGRYASVRGIKPDWNFTTINGFETASPAKGSSGRQVPLDIMGGELLQSVQVYKSKTADMDGQGIGGSINIDTNSPLQGSDFGGQINVRTGVEAERQGNPYYENDTPYNADFSLNGKISDKLAWTFGASTSHRQYLAQGVYQDDWAELEGDSGIELPGKTKNNYYVIGRDRHSFTSAIEYQATESTNILLSGFHSEFNEMQHRNRFEVLLPTSEDDIDRIEGDEIFFKEGALGVNTNMRNQDIRSRLTNISLIAKTDADDWQFSYGVNYSTSQYKEDTWDWRYKQARDLGSDSAVIDSNGMVHINEGGVAHGQADNFQLDELRRGKTYNDQDIYSAKVDAQYMYELGGLDMTAKFGMKYSINDKVYDYGIEYNDISGDTVGLGIDGGFVNDVNGIHRSNVWINNDFLQDQYYNSGRFNLNAEKSAAAGIRNDKTIKEKISAAYAMNTIELDDMNIIAGVRIENTDVVTTGFKEEDDGSFTEASMNGNSTAVLPSLLVNYYLTDDITLRASATTAIGRPEFDKLSATTTEDYDDEGNRVIRIGNPDLDSYYATSYDISAEWYPTESSVVSLALFKKDIDDLIVTDTVTSDDPENPGNNLTVISYRNADEAKVDGWEFNLAHQFDALPEPFNGLGVTYSFTSIDAKQYDDEGISSEIANQPNKIQSVTLFYENDDYYAGLTYNESGSFLTSDNVDPSKRVYEEKYGRLDFRASYNITKKWNIYADVNNITNEPTREYQGGNGNHITEVEYVGRTYYLGTQASF